MYIPSGHVLATVAFDLAFVTRFRRDIRCTAIRSVMQAIQIAIKMCG
jgi:hypothetical protein